MIEKQPIGLAGELDALTSAPATPRGPECSIGALLRYADFDVAVSLRTVLDQTEVSATAIADALSRHGSRITAATVARHRRRGQSNGCRCER
ncbi:hypothetical protein ACIBCC_30235 [Streptomyces griseus]|uniref:hypothetical protein n=1 Tax=Streptomyces griseus TaxID=1911 RepID=UPI0037965935